MAAGITVRQAVRNERYEQPLAYRSLLNTFRDENATHREGRYGEALSSLLPWVFGSTGAVGESWVNDREPGSSEPSDEALARRVREGDREALERLVRRYIRPIHAVAASYLSVGADVEDAAQETFLRVLDRIEGYDASRPFAPWLYQIVRNIARDRLAAGSRWRFEPLPDDGPQSPSAGPDLAAERAEIRAQVEAAISRLPEQQRRCFRLHDVDGFTSTEVAGMTGLSAGTVRSHVHHARRALRAALVDRLGEPKKAGG